MEIYPSWPWWKRSGTSTTIATVIMRRWPTPAAAWPPWSASAAGRFQRSVAKGSPKRQRGRPRWRFGLALQLPRLFHHLTPCKARIFQNTDDGIFVNLRRLGAEGGLLAGAIHLYLLCPRQRFECFFHSRRSGGGSGHAGDGDGVRQAVARVSFRIGGFLFAAGRLAPGRNHPRPDQARTDG